ncbi:MAG: hypothetical protein ABI537_05295 [Casimicrobiaceae bacterium]
MNALPPRVESAREHWTWRGHARPPFTVVTGPGQESVWDYPRPPRIALDCRVDGAAARPQPGGFYGGWVTPELVGPFKGEPGSQGW